MKTIYTGGFVPNLAIEDDPENPFFGWLLAQHPDGQMVSLAKIDGVNEKPVSSLPAGYVIERGSEAYKELVITAPDGSQQIFWPDDAAYEVMENMIESRTADPEVMKEAEFVPAPVQLERYDAGLLNNRGGGDVSWWQDYIRSELEMAHDFYQAQIDGGHENVQ